MSLGTVNNMERFINQKVTFKDGTTGVVTSISKEDGFITVKTANKERYLTPEYIINGNLVFDDQELQEIAISVFNEFKQYIEELENAQNEEFIANAWNKYVSRIRRDIGDSNVAFKCAFCNGGASENTLGYNGPCSIDVRRFNVEHRKWCGGPYCRCGKLIREEISQEEFDKKALLDERMAFLCYESRMFKDWVCYAGMDENGTPRALPKAQVGSLAVMTTRPIKDGKEVPQEETQIFGVFLIAKHNDLSDIGGSVTAHPKYRIELTPEEAKQMLFWKYHSNKNKKEKALWDSGLYRSLSDMECCQILKDMVDVIKEPNKKSLAEELLNKFKEETGIENILDPEGPLT